MVLATAQNVKDRLHVIQGISSQMPAGLTDAIILDYVGQANGDVLGVLGVTADPSADPVLSSARGAVVDLAVTRIRRDYFGSGDPGFHDEMRRYEEAILARIGNVPGKSTSIGIEAWGGR